MIEPFHWKQKLPHPEFVDQACSFGAPCATLVPRKKQENNNQISNIKAVKLVLVKSLNQESILSILTDVNTHKAITWSKNLDCIESGDY